MGLTESEILSPGVPLEAVICTDELDSRPSRPPDYQAENRALIALASALAESPHTILQTLTETILDLLGCGSAGVSLLTQDEQRFHWPSIAGRWKPHIGGGTPRDFGPCGDVLVRNCPLLMKHVERRYPYFQSVTPPVAECLLVPFYFKGKGVGTVWAVIHDEPGEGRNFDREDLRTLERLSVFASSAYAAVESLSRHDQQTRTMRNMNEALLVSGLRQHELTEAAEISQQAFRDYAEAILRTSPVPLLVLENDLRVVTANEAFYQKFQVAREQTAGRRIYELGSGQWNVPKLRELLEEILPRHNSFEQYEVTFDFQHIGTRTMLLNARRMEVQAGGPERIVLVIEDITERKQSEQSRRDSEERFRMLADNMDQLAWVCDTLGNVIWYNQRWLDYTGLSFAETQGWNWSKVQHPDHLERVLERVRRSSEIGESWEDTFPLRGKDGQYRWFLSRAVPIRDAAGNVVRWFGTNTDINAQRELENEISRQAQSLADQSRRKDEFLAMLSHELRNPLAPIMNAVQLLRLDKNGTELQREAQGMIERQVSQLARLVDDLLEVSRISTGRIHLQEERIDLRGVVEQAIESTRSITGQKSQTVAPLLPAEPVWVLGDPVRLEQVVVNLLNNASKYTDRQGQIWIELSQGGEAQQGEEAELRVRDNGIGIAPELLPRIFDLFTQADKSLDRSQGGLGIGLALVQSLVTMHRGRVAAFSTLGQGSEFIVRLPVLLSPSIPAKEPAEAIDEDGPSLKVLVVDDNIDAAKGIARLLQSYGHQSRVAHEGAAAMQAALEFVPDVVLLDIGLPVISGYQVAQWIRQERTLRSAVLVALTGYGQESDRQRSQEAGFDYHLVKPADFAHVHSILSAVAGKSK